MSNGGEEGPVADSEGLVAFGFRDFIDGDEEEGVGGSVYEMIDGAALGEEFRN